MFLLRIIWAFIHALFATRADLVAENLALRQQLIILHRKSRRPRLKTKDRAFWLWLARSWDGWRESLIVVKPATVVRWHRQGFKYYWAWKSRHKGGRPAVDPEVRDLIRRMSRANPLWGAPCIHGELLKLGIDLSETTVAIVASVSPQPRKRPRVHRLLYRADSDLQRDRVSRCEMDRATDRGSVSLGQRSAKSAPRSPWQNPHVERVIGTLRRDCIDHVIVFNDNHLRRLLRDYLA